MQTELDYKEIGRRIAHRRKQLGLRQAEVCRRAGIHSKYLSCIERAASIPSLDVLMKIARALDITPNELLLGNARREDDTCQDMSGLLQTMSSGQLALAKNFLLWLSEQEV